VSERVARSRELVADGRKPTVVARMLQISRQAIYRIATKPPAAARRSRPPVDEVEAAIVEVSEQNPTNGYRLVTAWVCRRLGRAVNRKRVLKVMRERKLIQPRTHGAAPASARALQGGATRAAVASGHDLDLGR
jgi:hypothetical protein